MCYPLWQIDPGQQLSTHPGCLLTAPLPQQNGGENRKGKSEKNVWVGIKAV